MLSLADIREARERVSGVARHTPLERSRSFSEMSGADLHLKLENFQRTGAFKIRGAMNRIQTLSDAEREAGVVTASAGNHAQGVALAASRAGVDATVVMPKFAPVSKVKATRGYGASVRLEGVDYDEAQAYAHRLEQEEDRTYVHAFDDPVVMAGQGTLGLEIVDDCPELDTVVVPIGGGGLISGVAVAIKAQLPDVRVVGVQAEGAASAAKSLEAGEVTEIDSVDTIADGIATRSVGEETLEVMAEYVDEVVTVDDREIALALTLLLERAKTLVEGAGAVALAAVLSDAFEYDDGETIVAALCGGNIDLNRLGTVIRRGLVQMGRYLKITIDLKDRPGELERVSSIVARTGANVYAVHHDRTSRDVAVNAAELELELETDDAEHAADIVDALEAEGYDVEILS
ncbi:threonine dehydratase [Halorubrum distributum JCM 9100]|uniref:threonine ammonia-lyase n=5 Tax=Halorubrum distributum TaxID=29283 RepID=M0EFS0_9EURY|nr:MULTISPECIES: threonine ammonia-lyase [Halorubrum distributum group]ELZ37120.1 threonine dehydratase [Halorubrum terrestre JCM 10247]ELZ45737.1 threonine dehydratase [Halorubrum distributum JCM 9100]ELZ53574.1 threonine dehydratase [Halorubrum distributum JCM 10118]EMA71125.1 threonine dehydratase [Halorubrum arcis JCM 13916]MDV7349725.1 threonine ammonia-lyase [Halorubrum distributum]